MGGCLCTKQVEPFSNRVSALTIRRICRRFCSSESSESPIDEPNYLFSQIPHIPLRRGANPADDHPLVRWFIEITRQTTGDSCVSITLAPLILATLFSHLPSSLYLPPGQGQVIAPRLWNYM